jgi:hypothetical protein
MILPLRFGWGITATGEILNVVGKLSLISSQRTLSVNPAAT